MWRRKLLACVSLAALLAGARAVTCGSFQEAARCESIVTDAGICGWNATASRCTVKSPLPAGKVAITSLGVLRGRTLLQAAQPCVDRPTPEGFTCSQQRAWGKCSEAWMVQGRFCRFTCGMCGSPGLQQPAAVAASTTPTSEGGASSPADIVLSAPKPGAPNAEGQLDGGFCSLPAFTGPCRAAIQRWYYSATNKKCMPFLYGGCQGNANNFESFAACEAAAGKYCGQEPRINAMWEP